MDRYTDTYKNGLAAGVMMTDDETLRFHNGLLAALPCHFGPPTSLPDHARRNIPYLMDMLFDEGMIATVGYNGTPVITAARSNTTDSSTAPPKK